MYKLVRCYYCDRLFVTTGEKVATCGYCGKKLWLPKARRMHAIIYETDSWIDLQKFLDENFYDDSLKIAKRRMRGK